MIWFLFFYDALLVGRLRTPLEMLHDALLNPHTAMKINKMIMTSGLSAEQMFVKLPTINSLRQRHTYDREYCKFGHKADWSFKLVTLKQTPRLYMMEDF